MFAALPSSKYHQFLNNTAYVNNGFGMLATFIEYFDLSNPEYQLHDICKVSRLEKRANESTATYLSRVRGFANCLQGVTMDLVMSPFAIIGMDHFKYNSLLSRFTSCDASVDSVDLPTLKILMSGYNCRKVALCITPDPALSASRVTQSNPDSQAGTRLEERQDILPPRQAEYPPSGGIKWNTIKGIFEDKTTSPHYHSRDEFHWTVGCPALAALNLVCVEDVTKDKEISVKFQAHRGHFPTVPVPFRRSSNLRTRIV